MFDVSFYAERFVYFISSLFEWRKKLRFSGWIIPVTLSLHHETSDLKLQTSNYFNSTHPSKTFSAGPASQIFTYFSSSSRSNSTDSAPPSVFTSTSLKPFSL